MIQTVTRLVVFVCEHGAAKSPVAAAWLNRLADEARVPLRAIARGTDPEPELSPAASSGLKADGIAATATGTPRPLDPEELRAAWRIVSFGPDLTDLAPPDATLETWTVPAVSDGYDAARDAILDKLTEVIEAAKSTTR
jgi:protein-tyrosine-phosphatase